jgi:hypothetical protein
MAVPSYVSSGYITTSNSGTSNQPPIPIGVQAGQLMLALVYIRDYFADIITPVGWTDAVTNVRGANCQLKFMYRFWQSGDTDPVFMFSGADVGDVSIAQVSTFSGVSQVTPIGTIGVVNTGSGNIAEVFSYVGDSNNLTVRSIGVSKSHTPLGYINITSEGHTEIDQHSSSVGSTGAMAWGYKQSDPNVYLETIGMSGFGGTQTWCVVKFDLNGTDTEQTVTPSSSVSQESFGSAYVADLSIAAEAQTAVVSGIASSNAHGTASAAVGIPPTTVQALSIPTSYALGTPAALKEQFILPAGIE